VRAEDQVIRGQLNMLLLAVLQAGPRHPSGVREALRQYSGGRLDLPAATVNPALRRLEHLGLVTSAWSVIEGSHRRTYRLTPAGQDKLSGDRFAWGQFAAVVTRLLEPRPSPASR
jgi:DNA-binding PadR family transcriptional regulator